MTKNDLTGPTTTSPSMDPFTDYSARTFDLLSQRLSAAGDGVAVADALEAIRDRPQEIGGWLKLGQMMLDLNRPVDAAECYLRAVGLRPHDAFSRAMLGISLAQSGRLKEAEDHLRCAVDLDRSRAATHYNLGVALAEQTRFAEAEASLQEALRLSPEYPEAHQSLCRVLTSLGRRPEAVEQGRRLLELRPDDVDAMTELGMLLALDGRVADEATVLLKQSLRIRPQFADAHNSLGLAQMAEGRFNEAEASYERALALDPRFASAHSNLGTNFKEQGRLGEAVACYDMALRIQPDSVSTRWNRSLALLQSGDYERGWAEYEWRWKRESSPPRQFHRPMWDGSELGGRRILLWPEQGLGDTIQFVRYAELVRRRGGKVIFECQSPLATVLRSCPGIDGFIVEGQPIPEFDVHLPILSAPFVFKTTIGTVPNPVSYVQADPARAAHWRQMMGIGQAESLRIGIAWQGNPHHPLDRFRSARLEDFRPLARVPGIQLFSIQRGPGSEQLDRWRTDPGIIELTRREVIGPDDWADTAAIAANLDLVVTVDTATAHLAGALGATTWVALAASPDWRWMLKRSDSPWYPTMRLFRQQTLRDWRPVFEDIAAELPLMVGRKRAAPMR